MDELTAPIGDDTWEIAEEPLAFDSPESGNAEVPTLIPDDTHDLDEEDAFGTPPETELPDRPAP